MHIQSIFGQSILAQEALSISSLIPQCTMLSSKEEEEEEEEAEREEDVRNALMLLGRGRRVAQGQTPGSSAQALASKHMFLTNSCF